MKTLSKKIKQWSAAASIALLASTAALPVQSAPSLYSFREVANPMDAMFTQLLGVNNNGVIAGYYGDGTTVANHGFTLITPNHFFNENVPNAVQTQVIGINNAGKTGGFFVDQNQVTHGFVKDHKGPFVTLDAPGTAFNQILGVNDVGESAGYSSTDPAGETLQQAFIHSAANGFTYVQLNVSGIGNSQATGINDAHIVCGFYEDAGGNTVGFLWDKKNNWHKTLNFPGANFTQALGLNNAGQVVGVYSTDGGATTHGFVYSKQSQYISIDEPNSMNLSATLVNGINDRGQLVGFYMDAANDTVGFVATPKTPLW